MNNLAPELVAAIQSADGSLDVTVVPDDYEVEVETRNTVYRISGDRIRSIDGSRPEGRFNGCTFGGSMIKPKHVWVGGFPEFTVKVPDGEGTYGTGWETYRATPVRRIDVVKKGR